MKDVLDSEQAGGKAIRGGAAVTASYVVSLLISLAAVPLMARHLGVERWGDYVTVSAVVLIIGGLTEAGLTNLGVREYAVQRPGQREGFLRSLVGLRLTLTFFGVLVAGGAMAATGADRVVVVGTLIAGLALLLSLLQQTVMIPLQAELRLGWVAVLGVVRQALLSGFFIALVFAGAGLVPFFWAAVAQGVLLLGLTLVLVRGSGVLPSFDLAAWKSILREVLPYAVATAVGLVYFRIGVILMSYVSNETETGVFSGAFRIVEVLAGLPWIIVSSAFPVLARAATTDESRFGYGLQRVFEIAVLVGVALALGLVIGAPFAVDVVLGPDFEASTPVLQVQALGLFTAFVMVTWTFALLSLKLFRELLIANAAAAIVAIAATLVLASTAGAIGTAVATVLAEAVLALGCFVLLRRARPVLGIRYVVLPKALAAAVPGVVLALVLPVHPLAEAVIAGVVYLAIAVALRAVPAEVLSALRSRAGAAPA